MARTSFQVRRLAGAGYSTLRYDSSLPPGELTDYDSALRANSLQLAPFEYFESYFSANVARCYGEVNLEWSVNLASSPPIGTPEPTEVVLVYSDRGEPETVNSGTVLIESGDVFTFDHTGLPEGKWAYYSLFLRYQSDQDDYYEKAGSVSELVVKNYGSIRQLWERIPPFYRREDSKLGSPSLDDYCLGIDTYGDNVGPLLKFLSVVGYDMDRMRTILDYKMTSRDPQLAHGEVLDALASELGTLITTIDLGAPRLRRLMNSIGRFRRSKGTEPGTVFFLESLIGSNVTIDTVAREITVYSQRVNHILDPLNLATVGDIVNNRIGAWGESYDPTYSPFDATVGVGDPQAAGIPFIPATSTAHQPLAALLPNTPQSVTLNYINNVLFADGGDAYDGGDTINDGDGGDAFAPEDTDLVYPVAVTQDGVSVLYLPRIVDPAGDTTYAATVTPTPNPLGFAGEPGTQVYQLISPLTVAAGDTVSFSVHSGRGLDTLTWARITDTTTGDVLAYSVNPIYRYGGVYFDMVAPSNATVYVEYFSDDFGALDNSMFLLEKNNAGPYFDGTMTRGGWLTGVSTSIKDFRWEGVPHASRTLYHEDYERTKQILDLYFDEVLPIDVADSYTIVDYAAIM